MGKLIYGMIMSLDGYTEDAQGRFEPRHGCLGDKLRNSCLTDYCALSCIRFPTP